MRPFAPAHISAGYFSAQGKMGHCSVDIILNLVWMGGKIHISAAVRFGVVKPLFCGCLSGSLSSGSMISGSNS